MYTCVWSLWETTVSSVCVLKVFRNSLVSVDMWPLTLITLNHLCFFSLSFLILDTTLLRKTLNVFTTSYQIVFIKGSFTIKDEICSHPVSLYQEIADDSPARVREILPVFWYLEHFLKADIGDHWMENTSCLCLNTTKTERGPFYSSQLP